MTLLRKGDQGALVVQLQGGLNALGYDAGTADGIFGKGTQHAVEDFQGDQGLRDDGVVGTGTAKKYNDALKAKGLLQWYVELPEDAAEPAAPSGRLKMVSTTNDKWIDEKGKAQGLSRTTLRSDCTVAYRALMAEVHELGGILTTAGGKRPIKLRTGDPKKDKIGSAQSKKSLHYVCLAFDLALPTIGNRIEQPYVLQRDSTNSRKWIVWCQTESLDVPEVTFEATFIKGWKKTKMVTETVTIKAFNFTELAKKHGFERISGRRSFFRGGGFTGSETWHFSWTKLLVPGVSTFGEELQRIYPLSKCKRFIFWDQAKNAVWQKSWF